MSKHTAGRFSATIDGTTYTDRAAFEKAANQAELWKRGKPDEFYEGKATPPTMPRLTKRPRQIALTKAEREGALAVGNDVTLRVLVFGVEETVTGQVWALAPENGVWVATASRFYWVHRPTGVVYPRPENWRNYSALGRVA